MFFQRNVSRPLSPPQRLLLVVKQLRTPHVFCQACSQGTTVGGLCGGERADHDMPTVANYAYRRARCVEDDMMHIYQAYFSYFTGPKSFYPEKIIKGEPPNIKTRPKKQPVMIEGTVSKEEDTRREAVMREFA